MNENLFKDVREIDREDDHLQKHYTPKQIVARVWAENLYPRRKLLALAIISMLFAAATTGAMVPAIKFAIDDIFVARKMEFVYYLAAATFLITLIKTVSEYISKLTMGYLGNTMEITLQVSMKQFHKSILIHHFTEWEFLMVLQ